MANVASDVAVKGMMPKLLYELEKRNKALRGFYLVLPELYESVYTVPVLENRRPPEDDVLEDLSDFGGVSPRSTPAPELFSSFNLWDIDNLSRAPLGVHLGIRLTRDRLKVSSPTRHIH